MKFLIQIISFIVLFILYYVKTENIILWKYDPIIIENTTNQENITNIYSYAVDDKTGAELFVIRENETSKFILKHDSNSTIIENETEKLVDIKSPLIKYKSNYYCCSKDSLIWTDGKIIQEKKNNNITNFTDLKCLRTNDNYILVYYIDTPYYYFFNPSNNNWEEKIASKNILCINNLTRVSNIFYYITLEANDNDNDYYFNRIKYENGPGINYEKTVNISKENIQLYENKEIIIKEKSVDDRVDVIFLFTYERDSGNYKIYNINLQRTKEEFFEIKFFRFFNNFLIRSAGFILDTPFLYYSVESLINGQNYIGLADIEFNLLIFNIEENINNNKLYYNYGSFFEKKVKLFYFSGNNQTSFCPFIKNKEGDCFYIIEQNQKFDINNDSSNIYNNLLTYECNSTKFKLSSYCLNSCPNGFYLENGICKYCKIDDNRIFYIGSRECGDRNKCENESDSSMCYDCKNNTFYYNHNCLYSCGEIYGEEKIENNATSCITCKEKKLFFSYYENKCIACDYGKKYIFDYYSICHECKYRNDENRFYFNGECISDCSDYLAKNINNTYCKFCDEKTYFDKGECVDKCNYFEGFAKFEKEITLPGNKNSSLIPYCGLCVNNDEYKKYAKKDGCSDSCNPPHIIGKNNGCINCKDINKTFFSNEQICVENCPNKTKIAYDICYFCGNYFYYDNNCLMECKDNQIPIYNFTYKGKNGTYFVNYCEDVNTCKDGEKIYNGKCFNCSVNYYNPIEDNCYKCFCGGNFTCNNSNGKCNCQEPYYGYNCDFYLENGDGKIKIISLNENERLIKTDKNYFTYKIIKDNISLSNESSFSWQLFFNETEITNNKKYKKCFITETNEAIFGINKDIFEEMGDNIIYLNLTIKDKNNSYFNLIRFIIIKPFENDINFSVTISSIYLKEMDTILTMKQNKEYKSEGKYSFQYGIINYNNEIIPLSNYIESEEININLICSNNFIIFIKNDREEKNMYFSKFTFDINSCKSLEFDINEILNDEKDIKLKQIFKLMSYLNQTNNLNKSFDGIKTFINKSIEQIINKNKLYIESDNINKNNYLDNNIANSEPNLIFALINLFATKAKNILEKDKNKIEFFVEFFQNIFNKIFENNYISNNTLSENDIKSLFRTIDNLYDICIEKNIFFHNNSIFVKILNNFTQYLAYKIYPSESIRLIGNKITLLSYNLGEYQTNISFPYVNNSENIDINDFSTYSYDNYYLDEKICEQKKGTLFCLTPENYRNLISQINKIIDNNKDLSISSFTLNIYLLHQLDSAN